MSVFPSLIPRFSPSSKHSVATCQVSFSDRFCFCGARGGFERILAAQVIVSSIPFLLSPSVSRSFSFPPLHYLYSPWKCTVTAFRCDEPQYIVNFFFWVSHGSLSDSLHFLFFPPPHLFPCANYFRTPRTDTPSSCPSRSGRWVRVQSSCLPPSPPFPSRLAQMQTRLCSLTFSPSFQFVRVSDSPSPFAALEKCRTPCTCPPPPHRVPFTRVVVCLSPSPHLFPSQKANRKSNDYADPVD